MARPRSKKCSRVEAIRILAEAIDRNLNVGDATVSVSAESGERSGYDQGLMLAIDAALENSERKDRFRSGSTNFGETIARGNALLSTFEAEGKITADRAGLFDLVDVLGIVGQRTRGRRPASHYDREAVAALVGFIRGHAHHSDAELLNLMRTKKLALPFTDRHDDGVRHDFKLFRKHCVNAARRDLENAQRMIAGSDSTMLARVGWKLTAHDLASQLDNVETWERAGRK